MISNTEINQALQLTRNGQLNEATALLQSRLGGKSFKAGPQFQEAWVLPDVFKSLSLNQPQPYKENIIPGTGQFLTKSFSNTAGSRNYKLYVPHNYKGETFPLIIMLHGCTQSADDFAAGTRMNKLAEESGFLVAYPEQATHANTSKCWNWFKPGDQQHGRGEPSLIAGITRQIMQDYKVDSKRVYIAGLSAGGAAAAIMGETYPELYAAVGVHSGLAWGSANDLPSAMAAMKWGSKGAIPGLKLPTIVFHGDKDGTVSLRNGEQIIAARQSHTTPKTEQGNVPGGFGYSRTVYPDENGKTFHEKWIVHGAGHAWSGGSRDGTYTEPKGPDASREMVRFFLDQTNRIVSL